MIRGSCALVIRPKLVAVFRETPGLLNRVAFNILNASPRTSSRSRSRIRNSRTSAVIELEEFRAAHIHTPIFPSAQDGLHDAAGFSQLTHGDRSAHTAALIGGRCIRKHLIGTLRTEAVERLTEPETIVTGVGEE